MGLWKIWLVGLAITIVTSILIHKKVKIHKFFLDILVIFDIAVVGGIAEGWAIAFIYNAPSWAEPLPIQMVVFLSILTTLLIWIVGAPTLGIIKDEQFRTFEIVIFILVFIITSVCWSQPFINYNNNFEDVEETVVVSEQEQQLLYFCNIPVQKVSGSVSGDVHGNAFWVDGQVSGSISTSEELPYWYLNGNGDGEYNSVPTKSSKISFIREDEKPYVKIITKRQQTRNINHNKGEESIQVNSEWKEYIFYLPESIMQYSLN